MGGTIMSLVKQSVRQVRHSEAPAAPSASPASERPQPADIDADLEKILARGRAKLPPRERVERLLRALWNRKSGAAFYAEKRPWLYAYALKVMRNHADAESALSQTFVEFLEGRTDKQFFLRALRGNCENLHQRLSYQAKTTRSLDLIAEAHGPVRGGNPSGNIPAASRLSSQVEWGDNRDPLDILLRNEDEAGNDVRRALEGLSPRIKEVLILVFFEGLEFGEVAARLDVSVGTIRAQVFKARQYFRSRDVNAFRGSWEY